MQGSLSCHGHSLIKKKHKTISCGYDAAGCDVTYTTLIHRDSVPFSRVYNETLIYEFAIWKTRGSPWQRSAYPKRERAPERITQTNTLNLLTTL